MIVLVSSVINIFLHMNKINTAWYIYYFCT